MRRSFASLSALVLLLLAPQYADASEIWKASGIRTSIYLYPAVMSDLGLEVGNLKTSADAIEHHDLSVLRKSTPTFLAAQPWSMSFTTRAGHFEGVFSGKAIHQGGFDLSWNGGEISLQGFSVRSGKEPRTLEIISPDGRIVFDGSHLHWSADVRSGLLEMFNVDLRLSKEMARQLGREALAGKAVGLLSLSANVEAPEGFDPQIQGTNCDDWSGDQDVELIRIGFVDQLARSNGEVVMVPSARLKNVGTANVPWYSQFSGFYPPYNNDQHPFLTWSVFRVGSEGIHQLGVSDVKHAFLTINTFCADDSCSSDSHILGVGCEDVYGTGTNSSNWDLAYREEILAASGVWAHCNEPSPGTPSHFDPNGDCNSGDFSPAGENAFTHGLIVQEVDLADDTADYIFSSWYLVRDDIDIFNTMGYRQIDPEFSGSSWTFGFLSNLTLGSPVDYWVPVGANEADQKNEVLNLGLGNGHLQLAVKVTDLGDGYHSYDYALMNHDFDQGLDGFTIPLAPGTSVRSTQFRDIDQDPANDWVATIGSDSVSWAQPDPDSILPWGVLFNFRIEANSGPGTANSVLDVAGGFRPETLEIETLAPASTAIFADGFESGDTSAWN